MTEILVLFLPYIIVGLFVLALLLFLLSLHQLRRGRTGPYWRIRRTAGQRGGQLFLLSIALFGVASALALFSGLADLAYQRLTRIVNSDPNVPIGVVLPSLTVTFQHSLTPSLTITPTLTHIPTSPPPTPTGRPSVTPTWTPTPTLTSVPTLTLMPTSTFESVLVLTPPPSTQQPRSGAAVMITEVASTVSSDGRPVEPTTEFQSGIERIYMFFDYQQMDDRIVWTRILLRDGVPIQGGSYLWSLGESGSDYFFFGSDAGYPSGQYQVRLFLGEQEISRFEFSILPA
jgi:hypothetical protein